MNRRWLRIARELLSLPTAPLGEGAVAEWLRRFARSCGIPTREDRWGNVHVHYRRGRGRRRPLVFCAHMDHPGFVAGRTRRDGVLIALWRGGVPVGLFEGAKVRFFSGGRWVRAEVLRLLDRAPRRRAPRRALVRASEPIEPGSVGMWDFPDPRLRGTRLYARGHDCVSGCAALACLLDDCFHRRLSADFHLLFTRAEEGGFLGAIGAARSRTLPADASVIAIEASRALPNAPLGGGAVVRVGDRTSVFDPDISALIWSAAKRLMERRKDLTYQRRLMDGGTCEASVYSAYGWRTGGLCLPLGNYHNVDWERMRLRSEIIDTRDFTALVELLRELASKTSPRIAPLRRHFEAVFGLLGSALTPR